MDLSREQIESLQAISDQITTPCYVYFRSDIKERVDKINSAFKGRFEISFAVKANPNVKLLEFLQTQIPLLDVSSGGELEKGLKAGFKPEQLSFTGPGKTVAELEFAVKSSCGYIIVENISELEDLLQLGKKSGKKIAILLRINPERSVKAFGGNMSGRSCQFGFDEELIDDVLTLVCSNNSLQLKGYHIYSGTQCLDSAALVENYTNYMRIFRNCAEKTGINPEVLIFGSGMGIPYHDGDTPLDFENFAASVNQLLDELNIDPRLNTAKCVLELGRYLVGEAGFFLTRVVRKKYSRGKTIGICDGGLNHHLAATGHFGTIVHRNYPMVNLSQQPMGFTEEQGERFDLFGPMCTTIDHLAREQRFNKLEIGDVIALGASGAYGLSASPINFISHNPPKEFLVEIKGGKFRAGEI